MTKRKTTKLTFMTDDQKNKHNKRFTINVSQAQLDDLNATAKRLNCSKSEIVRMLLESKMYFSKTVVLDKESNKKMLQQVADMLTVLGELERQWGGVPNNINQIAKQLNHNPSLNDVTKKSLANYFNHTTKALNSLNHNMLVIDDELTQIWSNFLKNGGG